jgi:hypothetical protein
MAMRSTIRWLPNGRALTGQSHNSKRHGTTTLFAALEVATRKIIATHSKRCRRVEFLDHEQRHRGFSEPKGALAQGPSQFAISFYADQRVVAQPGRGMVLDPARAVA